MKALLLASLLSISLFSTVQLANSSDLQETVDSPLSFDKFSKLLKLSQSNEGPCSIYSIKSKMLPSVETDSIYAKSLEVKIVNLESEKIEHHLFSSLGEYLLEKGENGVINILYTRSGINEDKKSVMVVTGRLKLNKEGQLLAISMLSHSVKHPKQKEHLADRIIEGFLAAGGNYESVRRENSFASCGYRQK